MQVGSIQNPNTTTKKNLLKEAKLTTFFMQVILLQIISFYNVLIFLVFFFFFFGENFLVCSLRQSYLFFREGLNISLEQFKKEDICVMNEKSAPMANYC